MNFKKIKLWFYRQKEGIIIGIIIGAIIWYLGWSSFLPIKNQYLNSIITILILATIGAIIDALYEPNK